MPVEGDGPGSRVRAHDPLGESSTMVLTDPTASPPPRRKRVGLAACALIALLAALVAGGLHLVTSHDAEEGDRADATDALSIEARRARRQHGERGDRGGEWPAGEDVSTPTPVVTPEKKGVEKRPTDVLPEEHRSRRMVRDRGVAPEVEDLPDEARWPPPPRQWSLPEPGEPARGELAIRTRATGGSGYSTVHVRVRRAEDGEPLEGAALEVRGLGPQPLSTQTDAAGSVLFTSEPASIDLRVSAPGRVRERIAPVLVPRGRDVVVDVTLEIGVLARGWVFRATGEPPAEATVQAFQQAPWWDSVPFGPLPFPVAETTTDGEGGYVLDSVPRLESVVVVVRAEEHAVWAETIATGPDPLRKQPVATAVLRPGATLEGKIVGEHGEGAARVAVYAAPWRGPPRRSRGALPQLGNRDRNEGARAPRGFTSTCPPGRRSRVGTEWRPSAPKTSLSVRSR